MYIKINNKVNLCFYRENHFATKIKKRRSGYRKCRNAGKLKCKNKPKLAHKYTLY